MWSPWSGKGPGSEEFVHANTSHFLWQNTTTCPSLKDPHSARLKWPRYSPPGSFLLSGPSQFPTVLQTWTASTLRTFRYYPLWCVGGKKPVVCLVIHYTNVYSVPCFKLQTQCKIKWKWFSWVEFVLCYCSLMCEPAETLKVSVCVCSLTSQSHCFTSITASGCRSVRVSPSGDTVRRRRRVWNHPGVKQISIRSPR